nr:RNA-directed DNA polymerase, eukaryota, reverse transcriptase zinc-binding domain protein [Tanacetum cinerariifolium]
MLYKQPKKVYKLTTIKNEEHSNGGSRISNYMQDFIDCVNTVEMEDLCSNKVYYTWIKSYLNPQNSILKKLDRAMVNEELMLKFPDAIALFLPYLVSDHSPVVVKRLEGTLIQEQFVNHFQRFLGVNKDENNLKDFEGVFRTKLNNAKAIDMVREIIDLEIKNAMFNTRDNKAPGPDGYASTFIKRPGRLQGKMQIACCNVVYKCISKILIDKIKPGLHKPYNLFGNVKDEEKNKILYVLPFVVGKMPVKYLGVPLITNKLSSKERKQLINKAAVFLIPKRVVKEIDKVLKGFLCCKGEIKRGFELGTWEEDRTSEGKDHCRCLPRTSIPAQLGCSVCIYRPRGILRSSRELDVFFNSIPPLLFGERVEAELSELIEFHTVLEMDLGAFNGFVFLLFESEDQVSKGRGGILSSHSAAFPLRETWKKRSLDVSLVGLSALILLACSAGRMIGFWKSKELRGGCSCKVLRE